MIKEQKNTMILENQQIETDVVVAWRIVDGRITKMRDIPSVYTLPDQD